jgi:adsorption protein B
VESEVRYIFGVLDAALLAVLPLLAWWLFLSGLDDLSIDVLFLRWWRKRRWQAPADRPGESRLAVFVPLWKEHDVIGRMLDHNIRSIRYANYEFFVGVYPNDPETLAAVTAAAAIHSNVHACPCPHEGPTSKADCLNWILQHLILCERRTGERFDAIVLHDAEDLIHPDSFRQIHRYLAEADMIQVPVLPLPTPWWMLTHGSYCDEFAEGQVKDLLARIEGGGFLPSCGVGTALSRRAIDSLAESNHNRVFEPTCLTEDYELGYRLHRAGIRQAFVPLDLRRPAATREFFPGTLAGAIRQRSRWVTGIALQGWQRNGWGRNWREAYWFWRDRKGLLGNPVSLLANFLFLYGAITFAVAQSTGTHWGLAGALGWTPVVWGGLAVQALRIASRTACCSRIYGPWFASLAPLRTVWANWINFRATVSALSRFARARWTRTPLIWLKTEHAFPSPEALMPRPQAARARAGRV